MTIHECANALANWLLNLDILQYLTFFTTILSITALIELIREWMKP